MRSISIEEVAISRIEYVVNDLSSDKPVRVLFSCTGIGILNRGIESFFREAFDGLKDVPGIEAKLIKGSEIGPGGFREGAGCDEVTAWCLKRTGRLAGLIGRVTRRSAYAVEQWSSFPFVVREIRRFRPEVVFYSDANLGFLLRRFRRLIGVPFRLLFSNGGPCHPPFDRHDFVQQVAPYYRQEALEAGEPPSRHFLIPYGIRIPPPPKLDASFKDELRGKLGLPLDRPVILSVGWISKKHKRMDYVIEEVARLPEPRPFLQLLGAMDEESTEVIQFGKRALGLEGFGASSVPYERVSDYYKASDLFVLGSLAEGFGRVYLEALMHGLPVIGHRHPVIEYVLGDEGVTADLTREGELSAVISRKLADSPSDERRFARWESVQARFGWQALVPGYVEMFIAAAHNRLPQ